MAPYDEKNEPEITTSPASSSENVPFTKDNAWIRFLTKAKWYSPETSSFEKKLVLKLDLMILVFGCLSFFNKYLDQASITNAYVSGMSKDLHLTGDDINYVTAVFWASYCVLMIPACYLLTRLPVNLVLPTFELGYGAFTFGCAWVQSLSNLYAMRFMIGVFETITFTGIVYVIASWYKPKELARRMVFYCLASPLGLMFSGYLQAAAYKNLNGVNGLAGWRWLFIICTIITLPVSILGFIVFPDVPNGKKPRFLTQEEFEFASKRLEGLVAPTQPKFSWGLLKRVFGRWHFWVFVFHWCLLDQNIQPAGTPFVLYLKAHSKLYSITQINCIPTIPLAIYIVLALVFGVIADRTGKFWVLGLIGTVPNLIGSILLAVYDIGEGGRLFAFCITGTLSILSPMTMSWVSLIMAGDAEERAVVTASMNAIGQGFAAWTQLFAFPATAAPHFRKGFISTSVTAFFQILTILTIYALSRRDLAKKLRLAGSSD